MQNFYRLLNVEIYFFIKVLIPIALAAMLLPVWLTHSEIRDWHNHSIHERFEDIYAASGGFSVFVMLFGLLMLCYLGSVYQHYWGSKSIYTMLALPGRRSNWYWAKLIAVLTSVSWMVMFHFWGVLWSYSLYVNKLKGFEEVDVVMNNGLFLAMIRSEYLGLIFPLTLSGIGSAAVLLGFIVSSIYYGSMCERSRTYWGFAVIAVGLYFAFQLFQQRTADPISLDYRTLPALYPDLLLLCAVIGYCIWHSLRILRKGSIA